MNSVVFSSKPVLLYDGGCSLCRGNLKWLQRLDWLKRFDALPYQAHEVKEYWPHLKIEDLTRGMHLVYPNGRVRVGADALRDVFLQMPALFLVGLLMSIPPIPWVAQKAYFRFAPYRKAFTK